MVIEGRRQSEFALRVSSHPMNIGQVRLASHVNQTRHLRVASLGHVADN